ncbi:MAG: hypothetical protein J0L55_13925 [Caulobacterales bacterium]|nr:hypothetical protein [Caulobacterales bacterium]
MKLLHQKRAFKMDFDFNNYELISENGAESKKAISSWRPGKIDHDGNVKGSYNVTSKSYLNWDLYSWRPWSNFGNPYAITFTLKENFEARRDNGEIYFIKTDEIEASKNLKHFLNRFNISAFGHKSRSRKKKIKMPCVAILEGDGDLKNYHYHLIVDAPPHLLKSDKRPDFQDEAFRNKVCFHWGKTNLGQDQIYIKKVYDLEGWGNYILKELGNPKKSFKREAFNLM